MFRKILSAATMLATLFTGQAKAAQTVETQGNKNETAVTISEDKTEKEFKKIANKIRGGFVSTNGGVYPMKRKNQKQYRKACRQNPSSFRSKKHRSKN